MKTLTELLNVVSPKKCRFLARKDHGLKPMSHQDVATKAGMARSYVVKISHLDRWDDLPLKTIQAFSTACGVNLLAPGRQIAFTRRRKMAYIANGHASQRKMFARLLSGPEQPKKTAAP